MRDGQNLNEFAFDAIDDSVTAQQHLASIWLG